jgi:aromatic ring-opening dioxygenase LigB subunit
VIVFAAIVPHGDIAIEEATPDDQRDLGVATRAAMLELGRRFDRAAPDATVLFTPHNAHVEGHFAVVVAAAVKGGLGDFLPGGAAPLELECPVDRELAHSVLAALRAADLPAVGLSFGGNVAEESIMPLDWGTFVPLWHLGGRSDPQVPVVVVSPARDRPLEEHVRAGRAIAKATGERIAVVASADHGHTHDPTGPYGFDPAAEEFDRKIVELVEVNALDRLLELDPRLVADAKADSFWQLLLLAGALGEGWEAELLSYEAPTYYGMLCAVFASDSV